MTPTKRETETARLRAMMEAERDDWRNRVIGLDKALVIERRVNAEMRDASAQLQTRVDEREAERDKLHTRVVEMVQATNEEFEILAELGEAAMTKEEIGLLVKHGRDGLKYARLETENVALKARVAELEGFKSLISDGKMDCISGSFVWTQAGIDECKRKGQDMFDRYNQEAGL